MWLFRVLSRDVFFPLYEVLGSAKRAGGGGDPDPRTPPPPGSANPVMFQSVIEKDIAFSAHCIHF